MKRIFLFFILLTVMPIICFGDNEIFVVKEINLEMVKCSAGSFMMGSPEEEFGRFGNEQLHRVTFTKPFYIGKYEVTQNQFVALMESNPSIFLEDNNPVETVSYDEAKAFCNKLNMKYANILPQGYKFDLPTESQWEYACRAGTNTSLNNGKNITSEELPCQSLDEVAWYYKNESEATHIVGQKKPNAWGIYDMHGNVWEWCRDWYGDYTSEEVADPEGPDDGSRRVFRGGSCASRVNFCRSAIRLSSSPDTRRPDLGFRVALVQID